MIDKVEVSIVIAVYNAGKFLKQCMDTVCGQTLKSIEIICVDDGSEDDSVEIIKEYQSRDERIKLLFHKHTGKGAAGARNMGIAEAVGDYLLILDADDYFETSLAEEAYEKAKQTNADIVVFDVYHHDYPKNIRIDDANFYLRTDKAGDIDPFCGRDCPKTLFQISEGMVWNKMFRRAFVEENRIEFQAVYHADDAFFLYSSLAKAERITILKRKLVHYRANIPTAQTSNIDRSPLSVLYFTLELKKWLEEQGLMELYGETYLERALSYLKAYFISFKTFEAYKELYESVKKEITGLIGCVQIDNCAADLKFLIDDFCLMRDSDIPEYLFKSGKMNADFFPYSLVESDEKVVLYGAGDYGKKYFFENSIRHYCKIVAWVDKRYEELGFPICSPEYMDNHEYDSILIAISSEKTANSIRKSFIESGIDERKIKWMNPVDSRMINLKRGN